MDNELIGKLLPVFLAFVLGLVAEPIKRALTREKRTLVYDVVQTPIVSISDQLPEDLVAKFPEVRSKNTITKVIINVRNPGHSIVKKAGFLVKAESARLIYHEISERPARLVTHVDDIRDDIGEITISDFTLEPTQSIRCVFFTESARIPEISFEGSSKEDVVTWSKALSVTYGVDDHLLAIFKLWIFAAFVTPLISGVTLTLAALAQGVMDSSSYSWIMAPQGAAQTLGSLLSLYFYLKMIPHAIIVLEALEAKFFRGP